MAAAKCRKRRRGRGVAWTPRAFRGKGVCSLPLDPRAATLRYRFMIGRSAIGGVSRARGPSPAVGGGGGRGRQRRREEEEGEEEEAGRGRGLDLRAATPRGRPVIG